MPDVAENSDVRNPSTVFRRLSVIVGAHTQPLVPMRMRRMDSVLPTAGEKQRRVDHHRHLVTKQLCQCCQQVSADRWR
jgi:hypothetical protein